MSFDFRPADYPIFEKYVLASWMAFVAATALFNLATPHELRRRTRFTQHLITALIFLCFIYVRGGPRGLGVMLLPIALVVLLGNRLVKDCPRCGAVVYNPYPFSRAKYCLACGAALDPRDLRPWMR